MRQEIRKDQLNLKMQFREDASTVDECDLWNRLFDILGIFESRECVRDSVIKTNLVPGGGLGMQSVTAAFQSTSENRSHHGINRN